MTPPATPTTRRDAAAFRAVLAGSTLGMMALSWPLWTGATNFPRIPFVGRLPDPPLPLGWTLACLAAACLVASLAGVAWRVAMWVGTATLAVLVVMDQNRLQPWIYQYLILATALAASSETWGLRLARAFLILLYVHSGLSKLDVAFADELGLQFLQTALRPLGLDPVAWPAAGQRAAALAMAGFELSIGFGLAWRRTRRLAIGGAVLLHLALLAILGPWGLDHSTIVLVWNLAVMAEVVLLFGVRSASDRAEAGAFPAVGWLVVAVGLLPLAEPWGWWDTWPSFGLYASHNERAEIYVHEFDAAGLPPWLADHLIRTAEGPWLRLDATAWSRAERGVPPYPSGRVGDGLALWIAARVRLIQPIRVVHSGRAERLTGRRGGEALLGTEAIRRHAREYLLNAEPAGGLGAPRRWGFGTFPADARNAF